MAMIDSEGEGIAYVTGVMNNLERQLHSGTNYSLKLRHFIPVIGFESYLRNHSYNEHTSSRARLLATYNFALLTAAVFSPEIKQGLEALLK